MEAQSVENRPSIHTLATQLTYNPTVDRMMRQCSSGHCRSFYVWERRSWRPSRRATRRRARRRCTCWCAQSVRRSCSSSSTAPPPYTRPEIRSPTPAISAPALQTWVQRRAESRHEASPGSRFILVYCTSTVFRIRVCTRMYSNLIVYCTLVQSFIWKYVVFLI